MIYKCFTIKKNDNYDVKENNNLHTIMLNELKDKFIIYNINMIILNVLIKKMNMIL